MRRCGQRGGWDGGGGDGTDDEISQPNFIIGPLSATLIVVRGKRSHFLRLSNEAQVHMSDLYFHPYIPRLRDFDGTLVFANSHYRAPRSGKGKFGSGFFSSMNELAGSTSSRLERERFWTQAQILDVLGRTEEDQDRFYRRLRDIISPKLTVVQCFRRVAFAVAVQKVLPFARARRDLRAAGDALYATLDLVRPRQVLVLGMPIWKNLHGNERWPLAEDDGQVCRFGDVWAMWCYHPTAWQFAADLLAARKRWLTVAARTNR